MNAEIQADVDVEELFQTEDTTIMNGRASYTVDGDTFTIEADDATAMRAVVNSIVKALKIHDDMGDIDAGTGRAG